MKIYSPCREMDSPAYDIPGRLTWQGIKPQGYSEKIDNRAKFLKKRMNWIQAEWMLWKNEWSSGSNHTKPPPYQNECSPKNVCSKHPLPCSLVFILLLWVCCNYTLSSAVKRSSLWYEHTIGIFTYYILILGIFQYWSPAIPPGAKTAEEISKVLWQDAVTA